MQKSVTWYTVKDGKIDRIQITREGEKPIPENLEWIKSPTNNVLHAETPVERYDADMRYLSDEEWLKKQGKTDKRGRWYHKETMNSRVVYSVDEIVDENKETQVPPIENEPYQNWNEKKQKWEVDTGKKERAEKESKLGQLNSQIQEAERKQYRSRKAIFDLKNATEKDREYFDKYEAIIEELRQQITELEAELKSA